MGLTGERLVKTAQQPAVKVHIEELVLHGFAAGDRHRIAAEVERELSTLIGEGNLAGFRENFALERMNGAVFKVQAGAKPQATGAQIAQSVYRSLRQSSRASARALRARPGMGGLRP